MEGVRKVPWTNHDSGLTRNCRSYDVLEGICRRCGLGAPTFVSSSPAICLYFWDRSCWRSNFFKFVFTCIGKVPKSFACNMSELIVRANYKTSKVIFRRYIRLKNVLKLEILKFSSLGLLSCS